VIVLTLPNEQGMVRVAVMAHRHPGMALRYPTSRYNLPVDPEKGEGTINIGKPQLIHCTNLKQAVPHWQMREDDLLRLLADIDVSTHWYVVNETQLLRHFEGDSGIGSAVKADI